MKLSNDISKRQFGSMRYVYSCVLTAVKSSVPTLTHVIASQKTRAGGSVTAVTSLDDEVFVARHKSQNVEVYDAVTFHTRRHITVRGLGSHTYGMTACGRNKCLYLSSYLNDNVHRVELSGSKAVKKWSVASDPRGLSVNIVHNLVVACQGLNILQEYTTHGCVVREVCLRAHVTSPYHAIQLSTGDYVVGQNSLWDAVSVVGVDGQVLHRYGSETSDVGPMTNPRSLAVTKNDDVFVADCDNNRILSINNGCVQELALSVDGGIQRPLGLCLDESRGRLYVGEYSGQHRVLVFDGVGL